MASSAPTRGDAGGEDPGTPTSRGPSRTDTDTATDAHPPHDPLLLRQLRRAGLSPDTPPSAVQQWQELLGHITRAYAQHREDRYLLERSLDVSSREMQDLYDDLRRARETDVARERDKLRAIIDGFRDAFCILDREGHIEGLNPAAESLMGPARKTPDALLGYLAVGRTRASPGGMPALALLAEARDGRSVRDERARLVIPGQPPLPISLLLYPIVQGGEITGCALTFRDVSGLHKAEAARRRLALAVEASADAIYVTDPHGTIEYVNPAFSRITGRGADEAIGSHTSSLKGGRTDPEIYAGLWGTVNAGRTWSGRLLNRRTTPEGPRHYWAQTTIAPIRSVDDEILGFVAVQRDVTGDVLVEERRALEARAAEVRAQVASLLLGARDLDERIAAAVDALVALPGLGLDGRLLLGLADASLAETLPGALPLEPADPGDWQALGRVCDLTPTAIAAPRGILLPLPHAGGHLGVLWLGTRETNTLEGPELDLLRLCAGMIAIAIADDQARRETERAREAALAAVQAKARFLANMSHEIRTPMNGVLGMLEMLAHTALTQQQRDYVDTAHGSADSLLTIINDILDYSKIEAGKLDLEHIPFDARLAVEDITTLFTARAQSQGIELACFVPVDVNTRVVGDPTRLRQVLGNILGNAVKFTRRGEVVLEVSREPGAAGQSLLRFTVEDTGIGMTPAQVQGLFQPFVQADGSTTRRFGGTGLGLAISKQLVELMGGEIGVESTPGVGSRFWFTLPFETQGEEPADAESGGLDGQRVLAVDDHTTNLTILGHYLESWGVDYVTTPDPAEALELLHAGAREGRPFDMALLDMQMPYMDGLDLGRHIKSAPDIAATRLLMLSSLGQGQDELKEAGFLYSLTKPIRQSTLYDTLVCMRQAGPGRAAEPPAVARPVPRERLTGRVLLAEDNTINQRVALGMLSRLGLEVSVVDDGAAAVARATEAPFDVILMDCEMPVMDGFEATRILRQHPALADRRPPVIALTANAMAGDRERCIAAGMDDYIPKPIRMEGLRETLARWLLPLPSSAGEGGPPPEIPPVEPGVLEILRGLVGEGFVRMLDRFEDRSSELVEELDYALQHADAASVAARAQELQATAAQLGAGPLRDLCVELADLAREGDLARGPGILTTLRREHVRTLAAVAELRGEALDGR